MTDDEFISRFEDGSLARDSFHHADHVKMAFLYLCRYPALDALQRFSSALVRFAETKVKPGLYHETITWGFLFLIRERMARAEQPQNWAQFQAENADLLDWRENILRKYYRRETLSSDLARKTFLLPDKAVPHS